MHAVSQNKSLSAVGSADTSSLNYCTTASLAQYIAAHVIIRYNCVLLFVFCGQKDLMQMRFTLRCVQCMATSVLRDQQYTFCVRSLLAAEKALLIRNDLAGILRRSMPRLLQLMLSYGPMGQMFERTWTIC